MAGVTVAGFPGDSASNSNGRVDTLIRQRPASAVGQSA